MLTTFHLAGDPHRDESEELEIAVSEGLKQPGPHGWAACAAEPHLPAATISTDEKTSSSAADNNRSMVDHLGSAGRKRPAKNASAEYLTTGRRSSRCEEIEAGGDR